MSTTDLPGSSLLANRYRLVERLGAGGMSVVWRGFDEVLGRQVAVKVLPPSTSADPSFRRRLRAEAQAAARLSHPNITNVYDYGEATTVDGEPVPYVVMELIDGESLAAVLARIRRLPWPVAVQITAEVAAALAAAHARGIVHRDVTPANVMLTAAGAKVVDFGISALIGENDIDPDGSLLGTPAYLAPERLEGGQVSPATDVYAVGLLIYRTLIGQLPWDVGTTTALLRAHQYTEPEPLPPVEGLPPVVGALVAQCLQKRPADRPSSAELAQVLAAVSADAEAADGDYAPDWSPENGEDTTILPSMRAWSDGFRRERARPMLRHDPVVAAAPAPPSRPAPAVPSARVAAESVMPGPPGWPAAGGVGAPGVAHIPAQVSVNGSAPVGASLAAPASLAAAAAPGPVAASMAHVPAHVSAFGPASVAAPPSAGPAAPARAAAPTPMAPAPPAGPAERPAQALSIAYSVAPAISTPGWPAEAGQRPALRPPDSGVPAGGVPRNSRFAAGHGAAGAGLAVRPPFDIHPPAAPAPAERPPAPPAEDRPTRTAHPHTRRILLVAAGVVLLTAGTYGWSLVSGSGRNGTGHQATGGPNVVPPTGRCVVSYAVWSDANNRFSAQVTVANRNAAAIKGWKLWFIMPGDQVVSGRGKVRLDQQDRTVTLTSAAALNPQKALTMPISGRYAHNNSAPLAFQLNGETCETYVSNAPGQPSRQVEHLDNGTVRLGPTPAKTTPGISIDPGGIVHITPGTGSTGHATPTPAGGTPSPTVTPSILVGGDPGTPAPPSPPPHGTTAPPTPTTGPTTTDTVPDAPTLPDIGCDPLDVRCVTST